VDHPVVADASVLGRLLPLALGPPLDGQRGVRPQPLLDVLDVRVRLGDEVGPRRREADEDLGAVVRADERVRAGERQRRADDLERVPAVVGDDVGDVDRPGAAVNGDGVPGDVPPLGQRRPRGALLPSPTTMPATRPG
jgi:hypothetical protein